ncbi:MAG: RNA polymerase sigma-70 factor [Bacteroidota bacterium]|jgi:RNA polymerase sigma-70 factor (ECF subfamily)
MQNTSYITDEELLRRIKGDDPKALKILFERYYSLLCRFAFRFVKTIHLAEEAVSDVFLALWLKKNNIEIRTNLKTYLYTAVRNQSINYVKHHTFSFEDIETVDAQDTISELHPHAHMMYEELKDDIDALLKQLPEKRQIIFRMNRIDGLSYKEIAEILSISIHTVQNQMVAAVKFLSGHSPRRK